ncbi:hypothetical protein NP303_25145, partial [Salmonella enterica]|nr:hypothetical protein [Salmonella enterica]
SRGPENVYCRKITRHQNMETGGDLQVNRGSGKVFELRVDDKTRESSGIRNTGTAKVWSVETSQDSIPIGANVAPSR